MCKQNDPSVMEEVHRSIDYENGSNDQKSLSYINDVLLCLKLAFFPLLVMFMIF